MAYELESSLASFPHLGAMIEEFCRRSVRQCEAVDDDRSALSLGEGPTKSTARRSCSACQPRRLILTCRRTAADIVGVTEMPPQEFDMKYFPVLIINSALADAVQWK